MTTSLSGMFAMMSSFLDVVDFVSSIFDTDEDGSPVEKLDET